MSAQPQPLRYVETCARCLGPLEADGYCGHCAVALRVVEPVRHGPTCPCSNCVSERFPRYDPFRVDL